MKNADWLSRRKWAEKLPTGYVGGKTSDSVVPKLCGLMPAHRVYVEPFMGAAGLMLRKKPAEWDFGIDLDRRAVELVRAARPGAIAIVGDGLDFLRRATDAGYVDDSWLVYLDPPYLGTTRGPRLYRHEFESVEDHKKLLGLAMLLPCRVMLSGYWSELYASSLHRWWSVSYKTTTRGGVATEWVWCNFGPDVLRHDLTLAGSNYRERERIKRRKKRWAARLLKMPSVERQAILEALADVADVSIVNPGGARGR